MTDLTGQVFVVTGAGGGIGAATARVLVDRGARVVLSDLDAASIETQARELGGPRHALAVAADITVREQMLEVVRRGVETFDRLDGAVANAGIVQLAPAWEATPDSWERQMRVNVTGTFITARCVGEHLRTHGGGAIVNVASNCGKVGFANMAGYNASKAAIINLTRSLALEWSRDGINVNAVCPGGVDTPMLSAVAEWLSPRVDRTPAELLAGMGSTQLDRKIAPSEVGEVIAFLLSKEAVIIRGQSINVDGGETPY